MSADALQAGSSPEFRHSIQDDLESIIYVVFYGGLRYLPHNASTLLNIFMNGFFNQSDKLPDGTVMGGVGKGINKTSRYYSKLVAFESASLQKWLDGAFGLLCAESNKEWEDIESLGKLWSGLPDKNLPTADRVEHEIPKNADTVPANDATAISSRLKRKAAADARCPGKDKQDSSKRVKASAANVKPPGRRAGSSKQGGPSKNATVQTARVAIRRRTRSDTQVADVPNESRAMLPPSEIPARVRAHSMRTRSLKESPSDTPVQLVATWDKPTRSKAPGGSKRQR